MNKKIIVLFSLILLVGLSSFGFARHGRRGGEPREDRMHKMEDGRKNRPHPKPKWYQEMFSRLIGLDEILDEYDVKMRRIFLNAKEETIAVRRKLRKSSRNLRKLIVLYKKDKNRYKDELYKELVNLNDLRKKKDIIRHNAMNKIRVLAEKQDKDIDRAMKKWFKSAKGNTKKLDQFIDVFEDIFE